jgi:hypothetical protein
MLCRKLTSTPGVNIGMRANMIKRILVHSARCLAAATLTSAIAVGTSAAARSEPMFGSDNHCLANGQSTGTCCPLGSVQGTTNAGQSTAPCESIRALPTIAGGGATPPVLPVPGTPTGPALGGVTGTVGGVAGSVTGAVRGVGGG